MSRKDDAENTNWLPNPATTPNFGYTSLSSCPPCHRINKVGAIVIGIEGKSALLQNMV